MIPQILLGVDSQEEQRPAEQLAARSLYKGGGVSLSVFRRGYAAAAPISAAVTASFGRGGSRTSAMTGKMEDGAVAKEDSEAYSAWAPDPVTGYYRPANYVAEIDPAELREMVLSHRVRPQ